MSASPEWMEYLRVIVALTFVIGLIFLLKTALKRTGLDKRITGSKGTARLDVIDTMYLDPRRKLVLIRHDNHEHLLLLSGTNDLVVDSKKREPDATS